MLSFAGYHHYESKSMQASMEAQHPTAGDNMGPKVQVIREDTCDRSHCAKPRLLSCCVTPTWCPVQHCTQARHPNHSAGNGVTVLCKSMLKLRFRWQVPAAMAPHSGDSAHNGNAMV